MVDDGIDGASSTRSPTFRFDIDLEPGDLAALRSWVRKQFRSSLSPVFLVVFLCSTVVLVVTAANNDPALALGATALAILSLVVWIPYVRRRPQRAMKEAAVEAAAKGSGTVEVSESGVVLDSATAHEAYRWDHFIDLVETNRHLILRCSPMMGHVIPKRVFDNRKAAGEFSDFVDASIRSAQRTRNATH